MWVYLCSDTGALLDSAPWSVYGYAGEQGQCWSRYPNGTGSWSWRPATMGKVN